MEGANVSGAIPEEGDRHIVAVRRLRGPGDARGDRNPGPDDGHGGHEADDFPRQLHRATDPANAAGLPAENLRDQRLRGHPERMGVTVASIVTHARVGWPRGHRHTHRYGLLALAGMRGAGYQAVGEELLDPVLGAADLDHAAVAFHRVRQHGPAS